MSNYIKAAVQFFVHEHWLQLDWELDRKRKTALYKSNLAPFQNKKKAKLQSVTSERRWLRLLDIPVMFLQCYPLVI